MSQCGVEYASGCIAVKATKALGLVNATRPGPEIPKDGSLASLDF